MEVIKTRYALREHKGEITGYCWSKSHPGNLTKNDLDVKKCRKKQCKYLTLFNNRKDEGKDG